MIEDYRYVTSKIVHNKAEVVFIRKEANIVAHSLARVAILKSCFNSKLYCYFDYECLVKLFPLKKSKYT